MSEVVAVILAAGKGTRMKSSLPKALHPVLERPMLSHVVDSALQAGAEDVILVLGHQKDRVEETIRELHPDVALSVAVQEVQNGTGHAVLCALDSIPEDAAYVLVLNGDIPNLSAHTMERLVTYGRASGSPVSLLTAKLDDPHGYGRIARDTSGHVVRIVEQSDGSDADLAVDEVNVGTYLFEAQFLRAALATLTSDNAQGELYLTDLIAKANADSPNTCAVVTHDQEEVSGVNHRADLARAERIARHKRNHQLMLAGVTMLDPQRTYVGPHVELGQDITLGPGVELRGNTSIDDDVVVETGNIIIDTAIESGCHIKPYCHFESATVGRGCVLGPYARLRPAAQLAEGVKVGNFVEIKKSTLGVGSKANHLTYLGDATIGAGVNVGAGTITCNYDGVNKFKTVIGDGAFIGSNTELVAPVTVGDGAYVGAGSTIVKDVPARALGVGRARQRNIEGFAERSKSEK